MKLAIRKDPGSIPGAGFHYFLHPIKMSTDWDAGVYEQMGNIIVEVDDKEGERLIAEAENALLHQCEIAHIADRAEKLKSP